MSRDEILTLTGRELDAAVAENVMGWTHVEQIRGSVVGVPRGMDPSSSQDYYVAPPYSTDANAARLVLAEVERRGLQVITSKVLIKLIDPLGVLDSWEDHWAYLTSTPTQICHAALQTVEGV